MSLKPYPEYQMSGVEWVGEAPVGWRTVPLFAIARENRRRNIGMRESNLLSLSYGNVVRKDIAASDGLLPESFETYQILEANDIVFRLTDLQNDKRSLRTALAHERGIITSAYVSVSVSMANPRYLAYYLRDADSRKVFYSMGGGLRQGMNYADLRRLPMLLPPPDAQREIAAFLDRETAEIDAFIADQEELIALLAERRAATISHAVTKGLDPSAPMKDSGVTWLGAVPTHWEVFSVRHHLRRIEQGVSPEAINDLADDESVGVLKAGCVNGGVFRETEHKRLPDGFVYESGIEVRAGDLIVNRASGSPSLLGSAALAPQLRYKLILSDKTFRLLPSPNTAAAFLCYFLNSTPYREQVQASLSGADGLANNLPMSTLRSLRSARPPMREQAAIIEHLDRETAEFDAAIADARESIALSKERRAALISAAVTGKIDVRDHGGVE